MLLPLFNGGRGDVRRVFIGAPCNGDRESEGVRMSGGGSIGVWGSPGAWPVTRFPDRAQPASLPDCRCVWNS